jgi:predicted DNA binding protein
MRVFKIEIPTTLLDEFGIPDFFKVIRHIDTVQIYQYDRTNFFSLHHIYFRPMEIQEFDTYSKTLFQAQSVQVLERHGDEILCIMKQRNSSGFWPALMSGSWALLPPISIDPDLILFSIIIKEDDEIATLFKHLQTFKSFRILASSNPAEVLENLNQGLPGLTFRQREIMTYAQRLGYFDIPKKVSTQKIAEHFHVSASAIINHVQKAEKILMRYYFG